MRRTAPGAVVIHVTRADARAPLLQFRMTQALLDGCRPQLIDPAPAYTIETERGRQFAFRMAPAARTVVITVTCEPENVGRHRGAIGLVDGPAFPVSMFVLP
jgi:hypothetical protein